jgi:hypothetical protein
MDEFEQSLVVRRSIDQMLIIQQFGVNVEGMVDVANALVKEAYFLKNIVKPDAFVNKEQWSMIWMKEDYHAKFTQSYKLSTNETG